MKARVLFGKNVRRRRLALGLNQQALGDMLEVTAARVSDVERAIKPATIDTAEAFATALGVELADLFRDGGGEFPPPGTRVNRVDESARSLRARGRKRSR